MLSLPPTLDTLCFALFVQCDEFDSAKLLRAVFTTDDLAAFADSLPAFSSSKKAFVTEVKLFLLDKRLADGRVLLLPLLETLSGRYSPQEALHGQLTDLYQRVLTIPRAASPTGQANEVLPDRPAPPVVNDAAQAITRVQISKALDAYFDLGGVEQLCFDLGINYENLAGGTKQAKIRELILYCQRRGRLLELVQKIKETHSNATFDR